MDAITHDNAPTKTLGDPAVGPTERREYYNTAFSRIVVTTIPGGYKQVAHVHERLFDLTFVLQGSIEAVETRGGVSERLVLSAGDLVSFHPGNAHNITNPTDAPAKTLTVKFALPEDLTEDAFRELAELDWRAAQ